MTNEVVSPRLELNLKDLFFANHISHENMMFLGGITEQEFTSLGRIIEAARQVQPIVCNLPGAEDKRGFVLAVSKPKLNFPIFFAELGNTTELDKAFILDGKRKKYGIFAELKIKVLQQNSHFISSAQNLSLANEFRIKSPAINDKGETVDIPGGAIKANERFLISVSAFKKDTLDAATAIAVSQRAGLISHEQALTMAKDFRVQAQELVLNHKALLAIPEVRSNRFANKSE